MLLRMSYFISNLDKASFELPSNALLKSINAMWIFEESKAYDYIIEFNTKIASREPYPVL